MYSLGSRVGKELHGQQSQPASSMGQELAIPPLTAQGPVALPAPVTR